jgi:hypothetical protein
VGDVMFDLLVLATTTVAVVAGLLVVADAFDE